MPIDVMQSNIKRPVKSKKANLPRVHSAIETDHHSGFRSYFETDSIMPSLLKTRLHDLFQQIEKEFEILCAENISC